MRNGGKQQERKQRRSSSQRLGDGAARCYGCLTHQEYDMRNAHNGLDREAIECAEREVRDERQLREQRHQKKRRQLRNLIENSKAMREPLPPSSLFSFASYTLFRADCRYNRAIGDQFRSLPTKQAMGVRRTS